MSSFCLLSFVWSGGRFDVFRLELTPTEPGTPPAPPPPVKPAPPPVVIPPPPAKRFTVTATVDAAAKEVAYSDVAPGWSSRPYVALPGRIHGIRPPVRLWGPKGTIVCPLDDIGPHYDGRPGWPEDRYWETGARPRAETDSRTNGAGIDLSQPAATAIGIDGKGEITWAFELAGPTPPAGEGEPAHLTLARGEIGFHETGDNHGIEKYIGWAGYGAVGQPWCSIFAGGVLRHSGIDITGANAMARSWTTAPCVVKVDTPQKGDLAVFWRGSPGGEEGHVGFYVGEDATHVQVLGGNEGDMVQIEPIPKSSASMGLLGYWRPVPKVT